MDFRLFSAKIVHAELARAGYQPPSLRTVARWTASGSAPGWAEQAVRDLLGIQKQPAPDWDRLMRQVDAIAERLGVSEEQAAARATIAGLPPLSSDESAADHPADGLAGGRPKGRRGQ